LSHNGQLLQLASEPDRPDKESAFDRAWSAFITLDRKRQQEFLRCGIGYVGHPQGKTGRSVSGTPADLPNVIDRLA
jgi:AMMECR1 domain-containing protein